MSVGLSRGSILAVYVDAGKIRRIWPISKFNGRYG